MKKHVGIFSLLCLAGHVLQAQVSLTNMYPQNYYLINAASAGQNNCWDIYTGYRRQWAGIENTPAQGYISVNGRIGKLQGIGAFIEQSKSGLMSYLNGKVSYAYHVPLSENSALHAGASIGFNNQKLDLSGVIASDYSDYILTGNQSSTKISSDIGIMFSSSRLLLGLALPQVLQPGANNGENKTGWHEYFMAHGSYSVIDNGTWLLQGTLLYKNNIQGRGADIGSRMVWKDQYGLSAGYRTNNGLFLKAELKVNDRIRVAYNFETGGSLSRKSHEVMLGIRLCKKEKTSTTSTVEEVTQVPYTAVEPEAKPLEQDTVTIAVAEELNVPVTEIKKEINLDSLHHAVYVDSLNGGFAVSDKLIVFELNSPDKILSDNREKVISSVVVLMNSDPGLNVTVIGHSCKLGSAEFNKEISEARAKEIADELVRRGISADRIKYLGKGETEPLATGDSPADLARNRRVQIKFSHK